MSRFLALISLLKASNSSLSTLPQLDTWPMHLSLGQDWMRVLAAMSDRWGPFVRENWLRHSRGFQLTREEMKLSSSGW